MTGNTDVKRTELISGAGNMIKAGGLASDIKQMVIEVRNGLDMEVKNRDNIDHILEFLEKEFGEVAANLEQLRNKIVLYEQSVVQIDTGINTGLEGVDEGSYVPDDQTLEMILAQYDAVKRNRLLRVWGGLYSWITKKPYVVPDIDGEIKKIQERYKGKFVALDTTKYSIRTGLDLSGYSLVSGMDPSYVRTQGSKQCTSYSYWTINRIFDKNYTEENPAKTWNGAEDSQSTVNLYRTLIREPKYTTSDYLITVYSNLKNGVPVTLTFGPDHDSHTMACVGVKQSIDINGFRKSIEGLDTNSQEYKNICNEFMGNFLVVDSAGTGNGKNGACITTMKQFLQDDRRNAINPTSIIGVPAGADMIDRYGNTVPRVATQGYGYTEGYSYKSNYLEKAY